MPNTNVGQAFLESAVHRFEAAKQQGDRALAQLNAGDMAWRPDGESNSIAVIVQHLHGNMLSRWTNFLTADGEKPSRNRDGEFVEPETVDVKELLRKWNDGWALLFESVRELAGDDLASTITIRGQSLSVLDAIHRQLAHVSYHVGQIVYLARMRKGAAWETLSIPRGQSKQYTPTRRD